MPPEFFKDKFFCNINIFISFRCLILRFIMKYCLLILSSLVIIASCKKVETPLSKQEKMRAATWVIDTAWMTYLSVNGTDSVSKGVWPEQWDGERYIWPRPECMWDDQFKFLDNTEGTHVTGPNKCGVSQTDNIDFTWGLADADTKIYMYGLYSIFGEDVTGTLEEFEDTKFKMSYKKTVSSTVTARVTYKFKTK